MKAIITKDQLKIEDNTLYNSGSIQYYEIDVEFSPDWEGLTKYAVLVGTEKIKLPVVGGKLHVDQRTSGTYTIGFVGYTLEDDEKTYQISTNLECIYFQTGAGEIEANEPSDLPDPTTWETYLSEIQAIVNGAENVNISIEKIGDTTYITITDKTGTTSVTEVLDGKDAKINGVNTLTVEGGANVSIEQEGSTLTISATDTTDYEELSNKPKINNVELDGNKSLSDLGIKQEYTKSDVGLGNVDNIRQYSASNPPPYPVNSVNGQTGAVVIDTHDDLIPTQASSTNKLTTENFVNSTVATSTATFRGTYNSLAELEQVTADENDYGFVVGTDSAGNTVYNRYKYASGTWTFEYALNNSSFTAAQWEAIQSGITYDLVAKLQGIEAGAEVNVVEGLKIGNTTQEISNKIIEINPDTTPTQGSNNVIDSNAVYEVEKLLPTDRESGENVDIDNAQPYKVLDIVADGKYQQDTTSGVNKLPAVTTQTVNGITITNNSDGSYTLNGTASANTYFDFFVGTFDSIIFTGYYLKEYNWDNISSLFGTTTEKPLSYRISPSNRTSLQSMGGTSTTGYIQIENNGTDLYLALRVNNGGALSNVVIKPMLVLNLDAELEPYTGGIPSPNPNYPQTITQVTSATWNRVGKNLFDNQFEIGNYGGTNWSEKNDNPRRLRSANFIKVKPNTTYYMSTGYYNTEKGSLVCQIAYYPKADFGTGYLSKDSSWKAINRVFTTPDNCYAIRLLFSYGEVNMATTDISNVQIEEGSTATPYSPYQGQSIPIDLDGNEVCAVSNTIKDKLLVDRYGNVAIQKNVGKSILNGSEYWTTESQNKGYGVTIDNLYRVTISSAITTAISNQYKSGSLNSMRANSTDFCTYGDNAYFNKYDMTLEEFKTHISNNNLIVYYQLATPQIIPLPKLSILPSTLKGINHIWVDTNLGRTQIEVEYVEDLSMDIPTSITDLTDIGFDATKTQVLKNVQGTIQWVDE